MAAASGNRVSWRKLVVPGLLTLVMLVVLVWLGTWQLHRLAWKTRLLASVDRAELAPAVPMPPRPEPFAKVWTEGVFRPGTASFGIDVKTIRGDQVLGADLLAVLDRAGAASLLVDLGWVPTDRPVPPLPSGTVRVDGYVRPPEYPVAFGAKDDPAARRFYALDPQAIAASLGAEAVAPFTVVALGPAPAGNAPVPATELPRPINNHLQYALTWYGFAIILVVIFLIWSRKGLRA